MKCLRIVTTFLMSTMVGNAYAADPGPRPGDGIKFPRNSLVYKVNEFDIPNESGAMYLGPERYPFLNMYHRCVEPIETVGCLNSLPSWFEGCTIVQRHGIFTAENVRVQMKLVVAGEAYKWAPIPENVMHKPWFQVKVTYSYQENGRKMTATLTEPYSLANLPRRFTLPESGSTISFFDDPGDHRVDLRILDEFEINSGEVDDLKVSICNVVPGTFQLVSLHLATQSLYPRR